MIPRRSTAALPPHPLPFFSCATGALAPAFGFGGAGLAAAGFGAAGFAGTGTAGAGLVGGVAAGAGDMTLWSLARVPPPFATPAPSSVGSDTRATTPHPTLAA